MLQGALKDARDRFRSARDLANDPGVGALAEHGEIGGGHPRVDVINSARGGSARGGTSAEYWVRRLKREATKEGGAFQKASQFALEGLQTGRLSSARAADEAVATMRSRVAAAAGATTGEVLPHGGDRRSTGSKDESSFEPVAKRAAALGISKQTQNRLDRLARERPDLLEKVRPRTCRPGWTRCVASGGIGSCRCHQANQSKSHRETLIFCHRHGARQLPPTTPPAAAPPAPSAPTPQSELRCPAPFLSPATKMDAAAEPARIFHDVVKITPGTAFSGGF